MKRYTSILLLLALSLALSTACSGGGSEEADGGTTNGDGSVGADAAQGVPDAARPLPDAQPSGVQCLAKDAPVQIGYTCSFDWTQCSDQRSYGIECHIENLAGNVFSLCDCKENSVAGAEFLSSTVCSSTSWEEAEAVVNEKCGWTLR